MVSSPFAAVSSLPSIRGSFQFPNYSELLTSRLPDYRPSWHQLIIIGNGFDLECGLPSGFGSFIEARKAFFAEGGAEPSGEGLRFTKTIWDVILGNMGDADWCDIEEAIAAWVAPIGAKLESYGTLFTKTINKLNTAGVGATYSPNIVEDQVALYSTERSPYTGLVGGPRMLSCWPSPGPGIGSIPLPFKGLPDHATRTRGAAYRQ